MKFAKVLQQTLVQEDIPQDWIEAAIQYKSLKKCINEIVDELQALGLSKNALKLLIHNKKDSKIYEVTQDQYSADNAIVAEYSLVKSKENPDKIESILKVTLDLEHEKVVREQIHDLGGQIRAKLESLAEKDHLIESFEEVPLYKLDDGGLVHIDSNDELAQNLEQTKSEDSFKSKMEILIKLKSDSRFFEMLETELDKLDNLTNIEKNKLIARVNYIGQILDKTSSPYISSAKKSDLYTWRELFKFYLDSEVYFKYNETSNSKSSKSIDQIRAGLDEFVERIEKSKLTENFKNKQSLATFNEFVKMNYHLLKVISFQSINSEALRKIIKKFDKRTSLDIKYQFFNLVSDEIVSKGTSITQNVCYIIQSSVLRLIPQLDDYMCPICMTIAFKPIRLECGHVFCVTCLVKLQKQDRTNCPLCRKKDAVVLADSTNMDLESMELIKKYFPKEVKEKIKEREKERYNEFKGNNHSKPNEKCIIV